MTPPLPTDPVPTPLSDTEFRWRTERLLAAVEATVDEWLQQDVIDIDAARNGGMLELGFPDGSKIVLNTHPPLHELWLATRSGGYHYRFVGDRWIEAREGGEFYETLSASASSQGGMPLRFEPAQEAPEG